jgi:hypothetical protein
MLTTEESFLNESCKTILLILNIFKGVYESKLSFLEFTAKIVGVFKTGAQSRVFF